jgi:hypothetical protein
MMKDVDALNRYYDPLIRDYESSTRKTLDDDMHQRPAVYSPASFPDFALRCPDALPSLSPASGVTLFSPAVTFHTGTSSMAIPHSLPHLHGATVFPVRVGAPLRSSTLPSVSLVSSVCRPSSASMNIVASALPAGWLSVGSRRGGLSTAFASLNPDLSSMPMLLVEHSVEDCDLCSFLVSTIPNVCLSTNDFVSTCFIGSNPEKALCTNQDVLHRFLHRVGGLNGFDCHSPFVDINCSVSWLRCMLRVLSHFERLWDNFCCVLLSIPVASVDVDCAWFESEFYVVSPLLLPRWQFRCGVTVSSVFGDAVAAGRWLLFGVRRAIDRTHRLTFPPVVPTCLTLGSILDSSLNDPLTSVFKFRGLDSTHWELPSDMNPFALFLPRQVLTASPSYMREIRLVAYDPDFPAPFLPVEPSDLDSVCHSFGVPFVDQYGCHYVRSVSYYEMLRSFSFPDDLIDDILCSPLREPALHGLCSGLPFCMANTFARHIFDLGVFPCSRLSLTNAEDVVHCAPVPCFAYAAKPNPSLSDWATAYADDQETKLLWDMLSTQPLPASWTRQQLQQVHCQFRDPLRDGRLCILQQRLVLFQHLDSDGRQLMLIVVPSSLRRVVFAAYHAAPSAGHLKFYKTLHRLRSRFFWPKMRSDISEWCRSCAHCIATDSSIRKNSELAYSWPISQPFFVLHVDLWMPGKTMATDDGSTHVLAAMCDLTGFVVSVTTAATEADSLARIFMQDVLLKVGLCGLIVVDADSKFLGAFEEMCKLLGLRLHTAARANHKAILVKRFFRSLNKAVTIAANDRGTNDVFVEAVHCFTYAWNASVIDGTDIVRSVAALGREFQFPLDLQLAREPVPVNGNLSELHSFLRIHQNNARVATEILRIITEERRTYHRERVNNDREPVFFQVGDVVMVRVQVQSRAHLERVAKLSYRLRGPMLIKEVLGHGAYLLARFDNPDGPCRKYHAQDISLLPPMLWPVEPLDGPDLRYLNSNHAPLPHPLAEPFKIKLYNEMWFSDPMPTKPSHLVATQPEVFEMVEVPFPSSDTSNSAEDSALEDVELSLAPLEVSDMLIHEVSTDPQVLFCLVERSIDKLFFISFRLPGTLRAKWFLVAVDLAQTEIDNAQCGDPKVTGTYFVHFLSRHPADYVESDCDARWWPLWHEFTIADDNVIDFGKRVLIPPSQAVDSEVVLPWGECVKLSDESCCLLGPFDFLDPAFNQPGRSVRSRQYVPSNIWMQLSEICSFRGLRLPRLLPNVSASASRQPKKRKRARAL